MMFSKQALAIGVIFVGVTSMLAREWSDTTGEFKLEADFVEVEDGKVKLRDEEGNEYRIAIKRLSSPDRSYVKGRTEFDAFEPLEAYLAPIQGSAEFEAAVRGFLANPDVPYEQRKLVRDYIEGMREAAASLEQHDKLVDEAYKLIRRRHFEQATVNLRKASRLAPHLLDADVAAGVCLAMATRNFEKAEKHFRTAVIRG